MRLTQLRQPPHRGFANPVARAYSWRLGFALLLCVTAAVPRAGAQAQHPLDSLSGDEIRRAVDIVRQLGKSGDAARFSLVELREPPKSEVQSYQPGSGFRREAFVVVYDREHNRASEAVIDLRAGKLISWKDVPRVQPSFLDDDAKILQEAVKADQRWQAAMRKRGVTNFDDVEIDDWAGGYFGEHDPEHTRVRIAVCQYKGEPKTYMGRPIEGVVAYVDLNRRKVIRFIDTGVVPIPKGTAGFDDKSIDARRAAPKSLQISQPEGASFQIDGSQVQWQKWHFHFSMNGREGLVLSQVGYEDQGRVRSVLYRGSLSELLVPYGDPAPGWFIKNAFDEGEDSMGRYAAPLEPGVDVPEYARLFDAVFADDEGKPVVFPRFAALYERDGGLLWKHWDREHHYNAARRARELVLAWIATVGNYEYGFNWVFHQDGTLEMEALLTGFMETKAVAARLVTDRDPGAMFGTLIAPNVSAVNHQHFFNFRLDMDVDGSAGNSIEEINVGAAPPGPANPQRNAFVMKSTLLRTELAAARRINVATSRAWRVYNPNVRNAMGEPVGYMLMPGENSPPYAAPDSWIRRRAAFMNANLWVTPFDPDQGYAAGFYVNQSRGGDGLPQWVRANRSIVNRDLVLWYTLGVTHIPRPEEWPSMPVHKAGFKLVPCAFFDRNPALDVPRPPASTQTERAAR